MPDAGTDDAVFVTIEPRSLNRTWLDYGQVDFERGRSFTYDLRLTGIRLHSDLSDLQIYKEGSDGLCLSGLTLILNGRAVFDRDFGETAATCQWLDRGGSYSPRYNIFRSEIHAHDSWSNFLGLPQLLGVIVFTNDHLESYLEALAGDKIHGKDLYWRDNPPWTRTYQVDSRTLGVDMFFKAEAPGRNPNVDLDFNLSFNLLCNVDAGTVTLEASGNNIDADTDYGPATNVGSVVIGVLTGGVLGGAGGVLAVGEIEKFISEIVESEFSVDESIGPFDLEDGCPTLNITEQGDLQIVGTGM